MQNLRFLTRKIIGFFVLVVYYSLSLFLLIPTIFNDPLSVLALLIFFSYLFIEQIYKMEPPEDYKIQRGDIVIVGIFLIYPFLLVLSFFERETLIKDFLPFWNHELIKFGSIGLLIIGTILTFLAGYILINMEHHIS